MSFSSVQQTSFPFPPGKFFLADGPPPPLSVLPGEARTRCCGKTLRGLAYGSELQPLRPVGPESQDSDGAAFKRTKI